jgi:hypothetical protein
MTRLRRRGQRVEREDIWPGVADIDVPVILAGSEVGILTAWWHSEDRQEWRWSVELYDHR